MNASGGSRDPSPVLDREDDVAVEQGVRRADPDRQRVVAELRQLAALGAVELRIGRDHDERRVAGGRRLRRAGGAHQRRSRRGRGCRRGRCSRPARRRSSRRAGAGPRSRPLRAARRRVRRASRRSRRSPHRSRPSSGPIVRLGGERRGVAGIGVGSRQRVTDAEVEEDRGRHDRHRPHAGREADAALGEAAHDAVGGRQPEGRATGQADRR